MYQAQTLELVKDFDDMTNKQADNIVKNAIGAIDLAGVDIEKALMHLTRQITDPKDREEYVAIVKNYTAKYGHILEALKKSS
ncbi:MAG: hypothetical protein LBM98_03205 [Oscillospiraceae bacterium]|jgi:hypothetical protein|nr:hypothetical protein [Oscillospiraceae bacterium]